MVRTDENGDFTIVYRTQAFRRLLEAKPDLYVRVFDPQDETLLYTSESAVRCEAGQMEQLDISIDWPNPVQSGT